MIYDVIHECCNSFINIKFGQTGISKAGALSFLLQGRCDFETPFVGSGGWLGCVTSAVNRLL